jgi:hypothetical protein
VFVDAGAAPFDFDKKNELNYFVRTVTPQGEQRIYWWRWPGYAIKPYPPAPPHTGRPFGKETQRNTTKVLFTMKDCVGD